MKETKETPSVELIRQFMTEIGGEVLREHPRKRMADFRCESLVIELKTLPGQADRLALSELARTITVNLSSSKSDMRRSKL
jgi:hypothetical protein